MLNAEDHIELEATITRALQPLAEITRDGFRTIGERLSHLETRVGALEDRIGRIVGTVTRGRTTDAARLAGLEARVAELEALLGDR